MQWTSTAPSSKTMMTTATGRRKAGAVAWPGDPSNPVQRQHHDAAGQDSSDVRGEQQQRPQALTGLPGLKGQAGGG